MDVDGFVLLVGAREQRYLGRGSALHVEHIPARYGSPFYISRRGSLPSRC